MTDDIFAIFPTITLDNDFFLRRISIEEDSLNFFNYINHSKVAEYLSVDDLPNSPETAKVELGYWNHLFDRKSCFYWAIATREDNKIIGTCGFNYWNKSQKRTEVSYDLDHNYWGRGITTKALKAISDFSINDMKVQRIQATVAIDNISSIRVLEKTGFKREGLIEKYGFLKEAARDFYMYAKLAI